MNDPEPNTGPTGHPSSNPATNTETVACSRAPQALTATEIDSGESGATEETQVRGRESPVRVRSDGIPESSGYTLSREIARGGMGVVYAARDLSLDREVAVKVMLPNMNPIEFVRESQIAAKLPHPGIPPIHALGSLPDGRPFLAMKLIQGETLDRLLKSRPDPSADRGRFLATFEQMCLAVGYAHAQGIVHRDLKPSNVMVGAFGEVQVMDWGLAKVVGAAEIATAGESATVSEDVAVTVAGQVKGTPAYMAPEQARSEPVDARADVFALGGILAAILTGRPPFAGTSALDTIIRSASAKLDEVVERLDACGADDELVELARWCLAARAEERPANGEQVAAAVAAYRVGVDARLQRAEQERAAAEAKAAADLEAAAEQRQVRADGLVQALGSASTAEVPRVIGELLEYRDLTAGTLRHLSSEPIETKLGLHARLVLMTEAPEHVRSVADHLPGCRLDELIPVVSLLKPHAGAVSAGLWSALTDPATAPARRVQAACALAALAPGDERWPGVAGAVTDAVVRADPARFAVWSAALEPVRGALVPELLARYRASQSQIVSGKQGVSELAGEVSRYDLTANLLAQFTTDRPANLAELAAMADPRHFASFAPALRANKTAVVPVLKEELAKTGEADWTDEQHEELARRRAMAGAVLLELGEGESLWPLFAFPTDGDPTARSYLQERLAAIGADPVSLLRRFEVEPDVSAKRALLLALGEFPLDAIPGEEREALADRLLVLYREYADPGLHGAIDWLLRQRWGRAGEVAALDTALAREAHERVAPGEAAWGKDWFVNGEGLTFAVVRGPVEFTIGSPPGEPGRIEEFEPAHRKRIGRTFAIGTKEVTVEQFLRFRPDFNWLKRYSPCEDAPIVNVAWYDAVAYCNWLSAREGVPEDQWCYEPGPGGVYAEGMRMKMGHLGLTGYRLPTEAEWEFACRSGSVTSRYYGRGEGLLPRYGWYFKNSDGHTWPVGRLRPNELGLFDTLGNAFECVEDPALPYQIDQIDDIENSEHLIIKEQMNRFFRGGSFDHRPANLRSAYRIFLRPGLDYFTDGFRPVRTLLH